MTPAVVVLALGVLLVAAVLYTNAQRRLDAAAAAEAALRSENARLLRALGAAEQTLRGLANDPRLDSGLVLHVDMAVDDLRRAAGELGPS
jgi:hypothetical protein